MNTKSLLFLSSTILACAATTLAAGQAAAPNDGPARLKGYTIVKPIAPELEGFKTNSPSSTPKLPLWTYNVTSTRDGNKYSGVMVGRDPMGNESDKSAKIPTQIVPIVITTHLIGTSIGSDGTISIVPLGSTAVANTQTDVIKLVNPPQQNLQKGEDGLLRLKDGTKAPTDPSVTITAGVLESSNVNAALSLINMIELQRQYEFQVKSMNSADQNEQTAEQLLSNAS